MSERFDIDQHEAELGRSTALGIIEVIGGQRRSIPSLADASRSRLAKEIGRVAAKWNAARHAGANIEFPSPRTRSREKEAAHLLADVISAGLDNPTKSANDIAKANGVTNRRVQQIRKQLREERDAETRKELNSLPR